MSYDTTGPVKVNETKSLLLLILLLVLVGGGIALALHLNKIPAPVIPHLPATEPTPAPISPPPAPANVTRPRPGIQPRRRPPQARPDTIPEGLSHPRENVTFIKSNNVYVSITTNNKKELAVLRNLPPEDHLAATLGALQRIIHDAKAQQRYDATPEQIAALKALPLKSPQLTSEQQKTLADLFKTMEAAKPEDRPTAEKALIQAVAKMPIPREEQKNFEDTINQARDILRPDQLDLIDNNL